MMPAYVADIVADIVADPVGPWAAVLCFAIASSTALVLIRRTPVADQQGRFASIDGLRGYLATGVFAQHASIWYDFERSGLWRPPPSRLFTHLGESSVVLFFMITAFLFVRKIVAPPERRIDWRTLYLHRLARLAPLYLVATGSAFTIVAVLSDGHLEGTWSRLLVDAGAWLTFRIGGDRNVNGQPMHLVTASVAWSLQYEWTFYCALPLLALALRRAVATAWVLVAVAALSVLSMRLPLAGSIFYAFMGGAVGAYAIQWTPLRRLAASRVGDVLTLATLVLVIASFDTAYAPLPLAILTVTFSLIAAGNTLGGLLVRPTALFLGERSYGIYLLHPLLLYATFRFLLPEATSFSPLEHWIVIAGMTVVLVIVCDFAFRWIEKPGIALGVWLSDEPRETRTGGLASNPMTSR